MTIEGNNHAITTTAGRGIWVDANNVDLNLNNLSVSGTNCERGVQVNGGITGVTLNIVNCEITATYYSLNICDDASVNLSVDNSTITGWSAINAWSAEYTISVTNSQLIGLNDKNYNANGWNNFATVVLEGDTTGQTTTGSSSVTVYIANTTIAANSTTGNHQSAIGFNLNSRNNIVVIDNCTFSFENSELNDQYYNNGENNSLIIDGSEQIVLRTATSDLTTSTEDNSASGTVTIVNSLTEKSAVVAIESCEPEDWSDDKYTGRDYVTTITIDNTRYLFDLDVSSRYSRGYHIYLIELSDTD